MAGIEAKRRTQAERSGETTARLLVAARELFGSDGYAATSLTAVVQAAGVTKGALYHHFAGKRELFAAVYEAEQEQLARTVATAYGDGGDPVAGFAAGCRAFFAASIDPVVQRITLLDAPAALGWDGMREIEDRYSLALLKAGLADAVQRGQIASRPIEPLAYLLFGAICEAIMVVARAQDQRHATDEFLAELNELVGALAVR